MPVSPCAAFLRSDRPPVGSGARRRYLAGAAVLLELAVFASGTAHADEPVRAMSPPSGAVQLVAAPAVLVRPVPAGAVVVRALTPQPVQPQAVSEAGDRPAAGLGTMLLSMMGLVGWIALRRR